MTVVSIPEAPQGVRSLVVIVNVSEEMVRDSASPVADLVALEARTAAERAISDMREARNG